MPTVAENQQTWGHDYNWETAGHEWSEAWGTAADQWYCTILRRIHPLLPTRRLLEIAPGFGRWTPYLIDYSIEYFGVDLSRRCIAHCRRMFGPLMKRPQFLLGDGMSLAGIADESISLAFSFDSLVHVEMECLAAYASELARVLEPGAYAFLHHSNMGEYLQEGVLTVPEFGGRGTTVTAELVKEVFQDLGFTSLAHEKTRWTARDGPFCDCFTLVRKAGHGQAISISRESVFYNHRFAEELAASMLTSQRYTATLTDGQM